MFPGHLRFIATALVLVLEGGLASKDAQAQTESEQAEALIRQANELRRDRRDAAAFPLLQRAHALASTPRTAAQLGMVEMNLGYWLNAERHLSEALASTRDPWIHQNRDKLTESLNAVKAAIGEIGVTGQPPGAEVWVNGRIEGRLPLAKRIRVGEGPAKVELRAPGHTSELRQLTVIGGQSVELSFLLPRTAAPTSATILAPAPSPGAALASTIDADERGGRSWMRPAAWTATVLSASALGVGLWQTFRWRDTRDEFDNHRGVPASLLAGEKDCGTDEPNRGGPGCDEIHQRLQAAKRWATVGYVGAAAFGVAALTLLVLEDRRPEPTQVAALCSPHPGIRGALCAVRF